MTVERTDDVSSSRKTGDGSMGTTTFWLTVAEVAILGIGFIVWILGWF
jgi:hypothetical protein